MRSLEVLLVLLCALVSVAILFRRTPGRTVLWLWIPAVVCLAAHAIFEGIHWQMAPAYASILLLTCLFAMRGLRLRRSAAVASLLLLVAACALCTFLPMFHLPEPTGPYSIGTQILHLVNDRPKDPSSADSNGKRELMIQIWYPASPSRAPLAPYRRLSETTLLSSYHAIIWTHARYNAPWSSDPQTGNSAFPLLLLNPAWNGRRTYYMYLVEELVSHGYIVVGIDHTGNSGPTAFPDGHVSLPLDDPNLDFASRTFDQLNAYGAKQLAVQVNDNQFVLDRLEAMDKDASSFYYHRLDFTRVGAVGHSFGGAVSAELCMEDPRVKSAMDMDGSLFGPVRLLGLSKPFLMTEEDIDLSPPAGPPGNTQVDNSHLFDLSDQAMMSKSNGYQVFLHGSTHSSFTDRNLFSPVARYSGVGSIPADREYLILRNYALAFFDKTLRGANPPLLSGPNNLFPETSLVPLHRP